MRGAEASRERRAPSATVTSMDFLYDLVMVGLGVLVFAVLIVSIDLLDRA